MPKYSLRSKSELLGCHLDLQDIFIEVIKHFDCTILQGKRGEFEQNDYYSRGLSKLVWPRRKHNGNRLPGCTSREAYNDARMLIVRPFVVGELLSKAGGA